MTRFLTDRGRRDDRSESGFTLIELMVVVLISAVLMAIGIPSFIGAKRRAQDRVPQATLKLVLKHARGFAGDSFSGTTPSSLQAAEPAVVFVPATDPSTSPEVVSVAVMSTSASEDTFVAASFSNSGVCFYLRDVSLPASSAASMGTTFASKASDGSDCSAGDVTALSFTSSW